MEFPARIDMSEWLNVDDSRRSTGPMWYELRGVVEHRGASVSPAFLASKGWLLKISCLQAHRGHFVCQVYDSE